MHPSEDFIPPPRLGFSCFCKSVLIDFDLFQFAFVWLSGLSHETGPEAVLNGSLLPCKRQEGLKRSPAAGELVAKASNCCCAGDYLPWKIALRLLYDTRGF